MPGSNAPATIALPASITQEVMDAAEQYAKQAGTDLPTMLGGLIVMMASPRGQAMMGMLAKGPMGAMLKNMAASLGS